MSSVPLRPDDNSVALWLTWTCLLPCRFPLYSQGKKADLLNRLTGHEMRTPKSTPSVPSFRQASSAIADKPESLTDAQIESLKDEKIVSFPADAKVSSQVSLAASTSPRAFVLFNLS